jgi:hypothetical protein
VVLFVIEAEANLGGLHLRREEKGYLREEEYENMKEKKKTRRCMVQMLNTAPKRCHDPAEREALCI